MTCLTADSCDNRWIHEILDFRTPRVRALFPDWSRGEVVTLVARAVLGGVAIATERGVLIGLFEDSRTIRVYAILGERGFFGDLSRVWRELYGKHVVLGKRHDRVRLFTLTKHSKYGFRESKL